MPRPKLICRKPLGSWSWHVALLIDGKRQVKEVRHHGALLKAGRGVYPLTSYSGALSVVFEDGDEHRLPLFDGAPLIFKLKEKWRGNGRRVAHITKGHFIVIAPKDWERIGDKPVAPKNCADSDFTAHYFYQDGSGTDVGGFRQCGIALSGSDLELLGQRVFDDSEDGDLFVGAAPELKTSQKVVQARIGEEASSGWSENFKPAERTLADVLGDRQGRFFVRVYDEGVQLAASTQFRYLRHLESIHVNDKPYTKDTLLKPAADGYSPTKIRFVGDGDAPINLILPPRDADHVAVDGDTLTVQPAPAHDKVLCALGYSNGRVDVVVDLPRVWWGIGAAEHEPDEWTAKPYTMTRQEFQKQAIDGRMALHLRLPRGVNSVQFGFDDEPGTRRARHKAEYGIALPLEDFAYHSQIAERLSKDAMFTARLNGHALPIIEVAADPQPSKGLLKMQGMNEDWAYELAAMDIFTLDDLGALSAPELMDMRIEGINKETADALILAARPWLKGGPMPTWLRSILRRAGDGWGAR